MASAGTADAIDEVGSTVGGTNFALWLAAPTNLPDNNGDGVSDGKQYVLTIAPRAVNTTASDKIENWTISAKNTSPASTLSDMVLKCVQQRQEQPEFWDVNPGDDAHILYLDGNTLKMGKWGREITDIRQIVTFMFGGLIGVQSNTNGDSWSTDGADIVFNPTSRTAADLAKTWINPDIAGSFKDSSMPLYSSPHGEGAAWKGSIYNSPSISDATYHTWKNIQAGKGDPCRMAGLTAAQVKGAGSVAKLAALQYAATGGYWRSPTAKECVLFVGGSYAASWKFGDDTKQYLNTTYSFLAMGTAPYYTDPGTTSLPVQAVDYYQPTAKAYTLPTTGLRYYSTGNSSYNSESCYWSSQPDNIHGAINFRTTINGNPSTAIVEGADLSTMNDCFPVRCVPQ